jgi:hypothetical protein
MDSFFDTSVIIKYGGFDKNSNDKLSLKCFNYILSKKGKFLLAYYVEDEIKNRIKKRRIIFQEVLNKIKDSSYEIEKTKRYNELRASDKAYLKKLYEKLKEKDITDAKRILSEEQINFEIRIDQFLKVQVDERTINIDEIKLELVKVLNNFVDDYADCKVLASAIQAQEKRETFLFVSCDNHFSPNTYDFVKKQFEIDYPKKNYKFPTLKNFLYEH